MNSGEIKEGQLVHFEPISFHLDEQVNIGEKRKRPSSQDLPQDPLAKLQKLDQVLGGNDNTTNADITMEISKDGESVEVSEKNITDQIIDSSTVVSEISPKTHNKAVAQKSYPHGSPCFRASPFSGIEIFDFLLPRKASKLSASTKSVPKAGVPVPKAGAPPVLKKRHPGPHVTLNVKE
jgi:hypothetical protein